MHPDYKKLLLKQLSGYETIIIEGSTYYILAQDVDVPCLGLYLLGPDGYESWCDKPAYQHRDSPVYHDSCRIGLYEKFKEKGFNYFYFRKMLPA